jgi:hypothetical protein
LLLAHTRHARSHPSPSSGRGARTLVETRRVSAEVTVDEVSVIGAHLADGFVEVEVEVRSVDRKDVDRIVRELERAGATTGSGRAKLLRALDLPAPGEVDASHGAFALLRSRLGEQLVEILAHDPGTRLGTDAESLHDMRVAFRRSRALLRAGTKPWPPTRGRSSGVKWAGEVLGAVRDLDVMLEHLAERRGRSTRGRRGGRGAARPARERTGRRARRCSTARVGRYFTLLDRFEARRAARAGGRRLSSTRSSTSSCRGSGAQFAGSATPADPERHEVGSEASVPVTPPSSPGTTRW